MSLTNIVAGDFGQTIQLTVLDTDTDEAANISGYNVGQSMIFRDPDGNDATVVAAFATDGSDGIVQYTLVAGDIDERGNWQVRVVVTSAVAQLTTTWLEFLVLE